MGKQKASRELVTIYCSIACCIVEPLYMHGMPVTLYITLEGYQYCGKNDIKYYP